MNFSPLYDRFYTDSTVLAEPEESLSFSFGESSDKHKALHAWSIDQNAFLHGGIMPPIPEDFYSQLCDKAGYPSYPTCKPIPDIGLGLKFDLTQATWLPSSLSYSDFSSGAKRTSATSTQAISPLCLSPIELLSVSYSDVAQSFEHLSFSTPEPSPSTAGGSAIFHTNSPSPCATPSFGPDLDTEGETDEDNLGPDTLPAPSTKKQRRRYSPYSLERPKRLISQTKPQSVPDAGYSSPVHVGGRTRSRNAQVDVLPEQFEQALRNGSCLACGFVPASRRVPDLRRHMNTHCADVNHQKWVCCGVPLEMAGTYNVQDATDSYIYKGHTMTGGCLESFSRRDALVRHLSKSKIGCRGSADLAAEPS